MVWSANTITECISKYKPSIVEEMDAIIASEVSEISKVREIFPNVEKVSVVYAVMEPVSCILYQRLVWYIFILLISDGAILVIGLRYMINFKKMNL